MTATDLLSHDEALGAVYIDFEGRIDEVPALLGVLYAEGREHPDPARTVLRHEILDPALASLADLPVPDLGLDGVRRHEIVARPAAWVFGQHLGRARAQGRLLVSWSQHERTMVAELHLPGQQQAEFEHRYRDGKATARRWRSLCHPSHHLTRLQFGGAHTLSRYTRLIGYPLPAEHGETDIGSTIGDLRRAVAARGVEGLTPGQAERWRRLLAKNAHDLLALRAVVEHATDELETGDLPHRELVGV